ncbi:MAG: hypothetical protein CMJ41_05300 [Phycisphaerae bacterium]|nr:hypothetical protein [Phycisphaerae bacterium]
MQKEFNSLTKNDILEINSTLDISNKYIENNKFNLAINILKDAEKKFNNIPEIFYNIAISNFLQAKEFFEKQNYLLAKSFYKKAESYFLLAKNDKFLSAIYINLSICYQHFKNYSAMKLYHEKIANLNPKPEFSDALLSYSKLCCADWEGLDEILDRAYKELKKNISSIRPFTCLLVTDDPELQYFSAVNFCNKYINSNENINYDYKKNINHKKIKIAYLSSDFHNHATAHLIAGIFEKQDNQKFDYYALSYGVNNDNSEISLRLKKSFSNFFDVTDKTDKDIELLLRELEIDIAVDLKGHTKENRIQILKNKPCPIQISYLGFPGTLGTNFIDYLILDEFIVNKENRKFFKENIIYLPDCYQCNDEKKPKLIKFTRKELHLPEDKIILCSLNNIHKYNKKLFDVWVDILKKNKNTVLWLLDDKAIKDNIYDYFNKQDIKNNQIILSPKVETQTHVSRLALADLFLDSFPCNAHTTASDALFANLPIITLAGKSMSSRVSSSLLNTIGLDDLVSSNIEEYKKKINFYIKNKKELKKLRKKIEQKKFEKLFNSETFIKNLELAYTNAWAKFKNGNKIADIFISKGENL